VSALASLDDPLVLDEVGLDDDDVDVDDESSVPLDESLPASLAADAAAVAVYATVHTVPAPAGAFSSSASLALPPSLVTVGFSRNPCTRSTTAS
jgi:hypothetical protein